MQTQCYEWKILSFWTISSPLFIILLPFYLGNKTKSVKCTINLLFNDVLIFFPGLSFLPFFYKVEAWRWGMWNSTQKVLTAWEEVLKHSKGLIERKECSEWSWGFCLLYQDGRVDLRAIDLFSAKDKKLSIHNLQKELFNIFFNKY